MRTLSRAAQFFALLLVLSIGLGIVLVVDESDAQAQVTPNPTQADTARLLGYMWGDGSFSNGVWDVNGPSGASSLVEELITRHGGEFVDRQRLVFRLPAPYDWEDWNGSLPNDSAEVRAAVENPHFLAALLEVEGSVDGLVYDQSVRAVPDFTVGRLIELNNLLRRRGFQTAALTTFGNINSGRIDIAASEWAELRAGHRFVCPVTEAAVRIPGGNNLGTYGDLQFFSDATRWSEHVRTDCVEGQSIRTASAPTGTCSVRLDGNDVIVSWSFTLGDVNVRRNNSFLDTVGAQDEPFVDRPGNGTHSYVVRLTAFDDATEANCGSVTIGGGGGEVPPAAPNGSCVATAAGASVLLTWGDFGSSNYQIRQNGRWYQTAGNTNRATVSGSINDIWEIRYRSGGVPIDVRCQADGAAAPAPAPANSPCVVSAAGGGVLVDWDSVPGETTYQVRVDGRWRATVSNSTQFVDVGGSPNDDYQVRYRVNGRAIDISCN